MLREEAAPDHVTPYDRFAWSDVDMERMLISGDHRRELIDYFGAVEYRALCALARDCERRPPSAEATRVLIVPGIMGSQLGQRRQAPLPDDVLWLDPIDIGVGRLAALYVPARAPIVPLGAVLYSYLRIKLHLRAQGFSPLFHDYDWRLGVEELGAALAERIRADACEEMMIVAHSMGGLVTRAALTHPQMQKVRRVVLLGTPHFGSFAPVQALRGTYSVVRKIARLVQQQSAESLASDVFSSFPSLYEMLPGERLTGALDLLDAGSWPDRGPRPDAALLRQARGLAERLAPGDARICNIVGVGQETVTSVQRRGDDFVYTVTRHGDGTVPATSAVLPGARTCYAPVAHSDLTRDRAVAAAVVKWLRNATTVGLATSWRTASRAQARVSDAQLRRTHSHKVDWGGLAPSARREFLQNLNEPPKLRLRVPPGARRSGPSSARRTTRRSVAQKRAKSNSPSNAGTRKVHPG